METDQWRCPYHSNENRNFSIPLLNNDALNASYFPLFKGIPSNSITEIVGLPGSGKTCFAIHTAFNALKLRTNSSVIYIDTSNNFTMRRFNQIFRAGQRDLNLPVTDYLDRINLLAAVDIFDLFAQLYRIEALITDMKTDGITPSLLIIDNIASPFKLTPRFSLDERLQLIEKFVRDLRAICSKYNMPIVAINQLTKKLIISENDSCESVFQFVPFLGKKWKNSVDFSIKLDGDENTGRFMELTKSIYGFEPLISPDEDGGISIE